MTRHHYTTSHDFANSRKPPPAKKKTRKPVSAGVPLWVWVVASTLGGALLMYLVSQSGHVPARAVSEVAPAVTPAPTTASKSAVTAEPPAPPKRTSPVFEFYTRLPANGAPTVDSQSLQTAPPSAAPPAATPAPTATAAEVTTAPAANGETAPDAIEQLMAQREAASATTTPPPAAKESVAAPAPVAAEKPAEKKKAEPTTASTGGRYALQTGAFRKRTEADAQRAKILLMGIQASVQPASNGMYRVVVGPFRNQSDMDDAKIMLDGNHISNIPVK